ncbi:Extracellular solute-binding protein family 3 [Pseudodesulfovibrio profundus]|uniref:Extracellular solute-binding protein family 3 n=1 Tax=Pseudodesulfovibrio profundus TaxID=57320 RepID=A0A2C8FE72_9BACT|nr:transporter substrate-binding domain-containing protein [Pseudodesulfovibrio profundus]SOB60756.1 Extracellular solute-binding protein family 3 [Pseudodesulfovibrio profundus]|tara:strand:- start:255 stop:1019 length:765 start_codon:yes stop_codon:yes gene_type:complete
MQKLLLVFCVLGLALAPFPYVADAEDKKVVLASLYWPPYTGQELPAEGASTRVVRQAFKAMGYELEIRFFPWSRAIDEFVNDPEIDGYFPEYPGRENQFSYSEIIGESSLGFAKLKKREIQWTTMDDLESYLIGTVRGYLNTPEFDSMVTKGRIRTDEAVSDIFNLRKVVAGRVDMGVVDSNTFNYLLLNDYLLYSHRHDLHVMQKLMGVLSLHVCFRKDMHGESLRKVLDEGLTHVSFQKIQREYIERYFSLD